MTQASKNFNFKEEITKCSKHQELIRFICRCNSKFCVKCLIENREIDSHFKIHNDFRLYNIKDLKNFYLALVEEVETILREIIEVKEKSDSGNNSSNLKERKNFINESFAFREIRSNLLNLISFSVDKYFQKLFLKEGKIVEELKRAAQPSDVLLDTEGVLNKINSLVKLKEKGKLSVLRTFEKINQVQNSFMTRVENFLEEFQFLLERYFSGEKIFNDEEDSIFELNKHEENPNSNLSNELADEKISHIEADEKYLVEPNPIAAMDEDVDDFNICGMIANDSLIENDFTATEEKKPEEKKVSNTLVVNLNVNLSRSASNNNKDFRIYNLEDIPDSINSKNSKMNTVTNFAEEANIFTNSNNKNLKSTSLWKDGIIPEISDSIENISYRLNSNVMGRQKSNTNSSISIGNKSFITEFNLNINKENRNRINNIIFYKKHKRLENLNRSANHKVYNNKKTKVYPGNGGQATPVNYNNNHGLNVFAQKGFKLFNQNGPVINNQENFYQNYNCFLNLNNPEKDKQNQAGVKANYVKKLCVDCYTVFNVKNTTNWKKRCLPCQKTFYEKITHIKSFYSVNSYKAGKMNQTCSTCKNTFIVPVALAKQRKTCYYCFKSSTNNDKKDTY